VNAETHPIHEEQVMAYLDGELSPDEAARVAKHLDQCASCAELAAELRGVSSRLVAWSVEPAPQRLSDAVLAELTEGRNENAGSRPQWKQPRVPAWKNLLRNRWVWAGAGAAVFVLCVLTLTSQRSSKMAALNVASREAVALPQDYVERKAQSDISAALENYRNAGRLESNGYNITVEPGAAPSPPPPPPPPQSEAPSIGPLIARTASLTVSVKEFSAARASVEKIVKAHQGYFSTLNLTTEKGAPQSLEAKLAIPAAQFDAALGDLRALGRVAQEQQSSEEVTSQVVDLDARLKNSRETEAQLAEILRTRTGKVGDVLEVEREMARVRGEIESMEAEQKQLHERVAFSSIDLNLSEEYQAQLGDGPVGAGRQLWNALVDGYHAAAAGLLKSFAFLLNVGPSLLLWGLILFWPARWAWRRWRSSRAGSAVIG
jgi:anti-sigma factor RsiW